MAHRNKRLPSSTTSTVKHHVNFMLAPTTSFRGRLQKAAPSRYFRLPWIACSNMPALSADWRASW
jgi:hypothetical protein